MKKFSQIYENVSAKIISLDEHVNTVLKEFSIDSIKNLESNKLIEFYNALHNKITGQSVKFLFEEESSYQEEFRKLLDKYKVKSPSELTGDDKIKFYDDVKNIKKKEAEAKKDEKPADKNESFESIEHKSLLEADSEYQKFFAKKLEDWKVKSPSELSDEDKKKFFDEVSSEWKKTSEADSEYQKFFSKKLEDWKVKSPNELSDEDKKKFFDEVSSEWKKTNENQKIDLYVNKYMKFYEEHLAKLNDANEIENFYNIKKQELSEDLEAIEALTFFKNHRINELPKV